MEYPSGTSLSHFLIHDENLWAAPTEILTHLAIYLDVNLGSVAIKSFTFLIIFGEVAVFRGATFY